MRLDSYFFVVSLARCLVEADLGLPQEPRRKELTLPRNPSWPSNDSVENAIKLQIFLTTAFKYCILELFYLCQLVS